MSQFTTTKIVLDECSNQSEIKTMSKILTIDDDLLFLEVLREVLEFHGFQPICARNGCLGLQLAQTQMPDLILCDVKLSGLNGYEVLKALRKNSVTQNIPVIFLTGEGTHGVCHRARELGANDCLAKPCILPDLIQAIEAQIKE
jgi:CheY-like chemotaxis protein